VLYCAQKGSLPDSSGFVSLCSRCWMWRQLPLNYVPQFLNELVCDDSDTVCLSGYAACSTGTRTVEADPQRHQQAHHRHADGGFVLRMQGAPGIGAPTADDGCRGSEHADSQGNFSVGQNLRLGLSLRLILRLSLSPRLRLWATRKSLYSACVGVHARLTNK